MDFKEWMQLQNQSPQQPAKPWKASKDQIVQHWKNITPGLPMSQLRIIPQGHKGPTFSFDGLRINGSPEFIDAVLSRIKELVNYEGGGTRLGVMYKQQVNNKTQQVIPGSYSFYLQVKQRGKNE